MLTPSLFLLRPVKAAGCLIVMGLSVCISVREYLWNGWTDLHEIFVHVPRGRGSDLLWRHGDTLSTSGFVNDVMFHRNGPYGRVQMKSLL